MDKKPLIGVSILAVVLLVMGSLSNVVGYQSVKSTVNDSPLFQTRTQRATNQHQNSITSQYLGKGNLWQFPMRDNTSEQFRKAVDIISKMDDKSFEHFTKRCIQRLQQDRTLKGINPNEIVTALHILRTKPSSIINSFQDKNNQNLTSDVHTICVWFPGCIPLKIIKIILFGIIWVIANIITFFVGTTDSSCMP